MSIWSSSEFNNWVKRNGLRNADAAEILFLTPTSVSRLRNGNQAMTPRTQAMAEIYAAGGFVSDDIDVTAEVAELATTCAEVEMSVITGVTAAAMRGWTTASVHDRFIALPPHPAALKMPSNTHALACPLLPERVEVRKDIAGNWYRLADPVRTVVDAMRDDVRQVKFHVEEVVRAALDEGVKNEDILDFAKRQGSGDAAEMWLTLVC